MSIKALISNELAKTANDVSLWGTVHDGFITREAMGAMVRLPLEVDDATELQMNWQLRSPRTSLLRDFQECSSPDHRMNTVYSLEYNPATRAWIESEVVALLPTNEGRVCRTSRTRSETGSLSSDDTSDLNTIQPDTTDGDEPLLATTHQLAQASSMLTRVNHQSPPVTQTIEATMATILDYPEEGILVNEYASNDSPHIVSSSRELSIDLSLPIDGEHTAASIDGISGIAAGSTPNPHQIMDSESSVTWTGEINELCVTPMPTLTSSSGSSRHSSVDLATDISQTPCSSQAETLIWAESPGTSLSPPYSSSLCSRDLQTYFSTRLRGASAEKVALLTRLVHAIASPNALVQLRNAFALARKE